MRPPSARPGRSTGVATQSPTPCHTVLGREGVYGRLVLLTSLRCNRVLPCGQLTGSTSRSRGGRDSWLPPLLGTLSKKGRKERPAPSHTPSSPVSSCQLWEVRWATRGGCWRLRTAPPPCAGGRAPRGHEVGRVGRRRRDERLSGPPGSPGPSTRGHRAGPQQHRSCRRLTPALGPPDGEAQLLLCLAPRPRFAVQQPRRRPGSRAGCGGRVHIPPGLDTCHPGREGFQPQPQSQPQPGVRPVYTHELPQNEGKAQEWNFRIHLHR